MAHLGEVAEPLALDRGPGPLGLLGREGHAQCAYAVLAGGVAHHRPPSAADVEQPLAGLQRELAGDQVELRRLCLLQRRVDRVVERAGVGHRRPEHQLVEPVGDVVVVGDDLGVAGHRVTQALDRAAPPRQVLLRRRRGRAQVRQAEAAHDGHGLARGRHPELGVVLEQHQRVVGVAGVHAREVEVEAGVGPREAEVAGGRHQVGQSPLRAEVHPDRRVGRSGTAAVVRGEAQRQPAADQPPEGVADRQRSPGFGACVELEAHRRPTTLS